MFNAVLEFGTGLSFFRLSLLMLLLVLVLRGSFSFVIMFIAMHPLFKKIKYKQRIISLVNWFSGCITTMQAPGGVGTYL